MSGTVRRVRGAFTAAACLTALTVFLPVFAGPAQNDPVSFSQSGLRAQDAVAIWVSPPVEVPTLLVEDAAHAGRFDIPYRIGFPMTTDLSPANAGTWEDIPGSGDRLWRLRLDTSGALWMVLGFDTFRLQYGASMWIYDSSGKTVLGPFTGADIVQDGQLWTPPVEGDRLIVELLWPAKLAGETPSVHLGTVSHGYKPFGGIGAARATKAFGESGSCNIDVQCPLGADWQDEKRGVVILLSGGTGFCSGSLINTTANDCRPYVLTANHCGAGSGTTYGFNFERPACNSGTPPPVTTQTVTGGTLLASFASSDFSLLQMSAPPPDSFDVYFNGWSRSTSPATFTTCIHHPSADAKKISRDSDPPINGSNWGANHWRVQQYEQGTTEGGSSGSPLFDQNSRIVGQLHGGTASCTSITYDEFGKVDASWVGGGTAASRLSNWLDPVPATGATVMDGVDWSTCAFNPVGEVTLNRDLYSCTDTLGLRVADDNLAGNPSLTVDVFSGTETTPEMVTLTENPAGSGIFTGSFPIAAIPVVHGDGTLSVGAGDTVTVTYIDADDGAGGVNVPRTDTATVDCTGPVISNVQITNVTGNSADVSWVTNEASNSVVRHGNSPPPGTTTSVAALVTVHSVHLTGLGACQGYVVEVQSTDAAGNSATDNNLGVYYAFTTGANVVPTYAATGLPMAIPDNAPAGITSTITVSDTNTVLDVNVRVKLTHPYDADLDIFLVGPNGVQVELTTDNGFNQPNYTNTVFDDEAATSITAGSPPFTGSFRPEAALSVLDGISAAGTWTLKVIDDAPADLGTLDAFELILTYPAQPCGPSVSRQSFSVADTCSSGGAGSANSVVDPGEAISVPVRLVNNGNTAVTNVTATITTPTSGVSIVDGAASYPNLALGQSAFGDAPFMLAIDTSVPCGTLITVNLAISATQGAWADSFTIRVGAPTSNENNYASTDTPKPIPDVRTPPTTSTRAVASAETVTDVNVTINISHTYDGDLQIFLVGPNGTRVELTTGNGGNGQNYVNTVFDDQAAASITTGAAPFTGSFRPETPLSALNGISAAGNWTLEITDSANLDSGTLNSWSLRLTTVGGFACTNCAVSAPAETSGLRWSGGSQKDTLEWNATPGATSYSLYRGTEATLPALYTLSSDSCQVGTTAGTSYAGISLGSDLDWFLVRASNPGGQGPAGSGTGGARMHNPSGVCP